jgi:hypothetical protein
MDLSCITNMYITVNNVRLAATENELNYSLTRLYDGNGWNFTVRLPGETECRCFVGIQLQIRDKIRKSESEKPFPTPIPPENIPEIVAAFLELVNLYETATFAPMVMVNPLQ